MTQELIIFLLSAVPVIEVRGAVPLGVGMGLSPAIIFFLAVLGSIIPIFPILLFLEFMVKHLRKNAFFDRFFDWLFARTRAKSKVISEFELVGLALFVAIPFPGTGVWTGTIAAYLLGLNWRKTFIAATIGTMIASLVLLLASLGILSLTR